MMNMLGGKSINTYHTVIEFKWIRHKFIIIQIQVGMGWWWLMCCVRSSRWLKPDAVHRSLESRLWLRPRHTFHWSQGPVLNTSHQKLCSCFWWCWNMLKYVETLTLCFSHFLSCVSYLFCFMFSPHQSSALGEEKMFSVRSKACPALRSGRISHHAGPWIQFALDQLQWTREFGFTWQAHGAWGAWGADGCRVWGAGSLLFKLWGCWNDFERGKYAAIGFLWCFTF